MVTIEEQRRREQEAFRKFQEASKQLESRKNVNFWERNAVRRLKQKAIAEREILRNLEGRETPKERQRRLTKEKQIKKQQQQQKPINTIEQRRREQEARKILDTVSKSGRLTKNQRDTFKKLGFDNRILRESVNQAIKDKQQLNKFEQLKDQISKGRKVSFREAVSQVGNRLANELINKQSTTSQAKLRQNLDTAKFYESLLKKGNGLRTVDFQTQEQAFKITVNQSLKEAGQKRVNFNSDVQVFQNKLKELNKKIKEQKLQKQFDNLVIEREKALKEGNINKAKLIKNKMDSLIETPIEEASRKLIAPAIVPKLKEIQAKVEARIEKQADKNFLKRFFKGDPATEKQKTEYMNALNKVSKGQKLTETDKKILNQGTKRIKGFDKKVTGLVTGFFFDAPPKAIKESFEFGKQLSNWSGDLGRFTRVKFDNERAFLKTQIKKEDAQDIGKILSKRYITSPIKKTVNTYQKGKSSSKQVITNIGKAFIDNPKATITAVAGLVTAGTIAGFKVGKDISTKALANKIRKDGARGIGEFLGVLVLDLSDFYNPSKIRKVKNLKGLNTILKTIEIDSKDVKIINRIIKGSKGVIQDKELKKVLKVVNKNTGLAFTVKDKAVLNNKNTARLINKLVKNKATNTYKKFDFRADTKFIKDKKGNLIPRTSVKGKGNLVLKKGDSIPLDFTLRENNKGNLVGQYKLGSDNAFVKQNIELIDEGGFYINPKTGEKIPKTKAPIKQARIDIKTQKRISREVKDKITLGSLTGDTIETTLTRLYLGTNKLINKREVRKIRISEVLDITTKDKKLFKSLSKRIDKSIIRIKGKVKGLSKPLSNQDVKNIEKFLKDIDYDKVIIAGRDKRTRIARALGLRKDSKEIKAIEEIVNNKGEVIGKFTVKDFKIRSSGTIERGVKPTPKTKFSKLLRAKSGLRKSKKGSLSMFANNEIEILTKKGRKLVPESKITIPELKFNLPLTKKRLELYNAVRLFNRIRKLQSTILQIKSLDTKKDFDKLKSNTKLLKKDLSKLQDIIKTQEKEKAKVPLKKKAQTQKKVQTSKAKSVTKLKTLKVQPKVRVPTTRLKIKLKKPKIPPIPKLKLTFDSKKLDNRLLKFEARFRERKFTNKPAGKNNPIIKKVITFRDTKNRVLQKVANRVDRTLARSLQLEVIAIGKAKRDIKKPSNLKKFIAKKSKNTPVLKLVEKSKNLLDTRGEKKEVIKTRKIKKKTTKKKKVIRKRKR